MSERIRDHIRTNVVGYIALFAFATGGSAYALNGRAPGTNSVGSYDIINKEVRGPDIAIGAVSSGKLAAGAVTNPRLANDSVNGAKVADGSLSGADVQANSFGANQVNEASLDPGVLQSRVSGSCTAGNAVRAVAQSGAVTCAPTGSGTITGVTFTSAGLPDLDGACATDGWFDFTPATNNEAGYYRDPFGFVRLRGTVRQCGSGASTIFTLPSGYRPGRQENHLTYDDQASSFSPVHILATGVVEVDSAARQGAWLDGISFRCAPSGTDGCP